MLRDLRAHRARLAMTLLAILLGVAFVVGTWVISDSAARAMTAGGTRADLGVLVQAAAGDATLTETDRARLAALPGVAGAAGVRVGHAALIGADGKLRSGWAERGGTSWDGSSRFALTDGHAPRRPGEIALEEKAAAAAGLRPGGTARVILRDGRSEPGTVVGLFAYRPVGGESTPAVAYDQATARQLIAADFHRVELTLTAGTDPRRVADTARQLLGDDRYAVRTAAELAAFAQRQADEAAAKIRRIYLTFAAVAVAVGTFVIANTFTMLVAERVRQFALLRAVGASRRQVRRAVLAEAVVVGSTGATLGVAVGIGLAVLALHLLRPPGGTLVVAVSPAAVAVGYAVGIAVTVIAAYGSARRGAAVAPVAALRSGVTLPRRSLVPRTAVGAVTLAAGAVAVAATAGTTLSDAQRVAGVAGALAGWIGVLLLAPLFATGALRPLARLAGRYGGPVSRLAVRNALRDPRRTAATASALMIGLALVCAVATVGETLTVATAEPIRTTVPATTLVVRSPGLGTGLDAGTVETVRSVPGVTRAAAVRWSSGYVRHGANDLHTAVAAVEPDGVGTLLTPRITAGSADLTRGVLVPAGEAGKLGIRPGDRLGIRYDGQTAVDARVAGLYQPSKALQGLVADVATVPQRFRDDVDTVYATGPDPAAARAALRAAFRDRPDVAVTDQSGLVKESVEEFELILSVLYGLLGAAVLIAVFGVVNTLALSVVERAREIGVLRALGASRGLIRRTVRAESLVISLYGGLLGIGVGLGLGAVLQHVMLERSLHEFVVPYPVLAVALAGMTLVGVVAAVWPAHRASRTDVLTAITTN